MFDDFENEKDKKIEKEIKDAIKGVVFDNATPQLDLTKDKDPEFVKEIIDLTKNTSDVEFVKEIIDLTDVNNDPKFIKEIIDLTKNNNP